MVRTSPVGLEMHPDADPDDVEVDERKGELTTCPQVAVQSVTGRTAVPAPVGQAPQDPECRCRDLCAIHSLG